jgi:hypothetical protein
MTHWKFAKAIDENEEFKINQMNIWNFQWHCLEKSGSYRSLRRSDLLF